MIGIRKLDTEFFTRKKSRASRRRVVVYLAGLLSVIVFSMTYLVVKETPDSFPDGIDEAYYKLARTKWKRERKTEPDNDDVLMLLAESAVANGDLKTAVAGFSAIPSRHELYGASARLQEAQVLLKLGRVTEAERSLNSLLADSEAGGLSGKRSLLAGRRWLAFIYSVTLRIDLRRSVLSSLHADGGATVAESKQYFFPRLLLWRSSTGRRHIDDYLRNSPDDLNLNVALASYLIYDGALQDAEQRLRLILQQHPDHLLCRSWLLESLYELDNWAELESVMNESPDYDPSEPHLFTRMRGELAIHNKQWNEAVRLLRLALRSDETNPAVHMGLARSFRALQMDKEREEAQKTSLALSQIRVRLSSVNESNPNALMELATTCRSIGLEKAAVVFSAHATRSKKTSAPDASR